MSAINSPDRPNYSYWGFLPSRHAILTGVAAAATLAAGTVLAVTYFTPDNTDSSSPAINRCSISSNAAAEPSSTALEIIANSTIIGLNGLGSLGSLAVSAYVNRTQHREIIEETEGPQSQIEEFDFLTIPKSAHTPKHLEQLPEKSIGQEGNFFELEESKNCLDKLKAAKKPASTCKAPSIPSSRLFKLRSGNDLESNLRLGFEVLLDTLHTVRISPNYLARSKEAIENQAKKSGVILRDFSEITHQLYCLHHSREFVFQETGRQEKLMQGRAISRFAQAKIVLAATNHIFMGNCAEMSIIALFKAMELGAWNSHVDVVSIEHGEHYVVVIGREFESDPEDYKTWGSSAVVVDSWAGNIFKLSEVETNLNDYLGGNLTTGEPTLRPFDPEKQTLSIYFGNIYSTKELINSKKPYVNSLDFGQPSPRPLNAREHQLYDEAVAGLDRFHKAKTLSRKLTEAEKLSKLCRHPEIRFFYPIKLLIDQIEYFIELYRS